MKDFSTGTASILGRCASAEIRARLAARRLTQRQLADGAGFSSHNYVSIRLRDEKPFTLDDIDAIVNFLEGEHAAEVFLAEAVERHNEEIWHELIEASRPERQARRAQETASAVGNYTLAADEDLVSIEEEQEETERST